MVRVHDGTGGSAVVRLRLGGPPGVCEAVIEVLREALPVVRVTSTADDRTDPAEIQVFAVAQVDRPDPAGTVAMRLECGCSLDVPGRHADEVGPIVGCDLHGETSILDYTADRLAASGAELVADIADREAVELVADVIGGARQDGRSEVETATEVLAVLAEHKAQMGGAA